MKKILIVCNYFAPNNTIAAVRITKLAKYLKREGYEVSVLSERRADAIDSILENDAKGIKVEHIENSRLFVKLYNFYRNLIQPAKDKRMNRIDNRRRVNKKTGNVEFYPFETAYPVIGSLDYIVGQLKQKDLFRAAKKKIEAIEKPDLVITSYGDSMAYFVGEYFHKKYKHIPWVFDIRDAVYRYKFVPDQVKTIPLNYERKAFRDANAIVGVSKGICRRVPDKYQNKVYCITNGFDKEDAGKLVHRSVDNSKLRFVYTGSMYGGLQDLSLFFKAVREMINHEEIDISKLEFAYAGNESAYEIFKTQAEKYELDKVTTYTGKISRIQAMQLQSDAHILLMSSFDYKNHDGGVLTGKMMEYMLAKKPVIAIVNGDIENSEVRQTIEKTGIGIVVEESNSEKGIEELKKYIKMQYDKVLNSQSVLYEPDLEEYNRYEYRNIVSEYIKVLNKV